jgi:hypothetical protein
MIGHELEEVIVNVAEISSPSPVRTKLARSRQMDLLDIRLNPPVILVIVQNGVPVEKTRVPATHLMITRRCCVFDAFLLLFGNSLFEQIIINPFRDVPVFLRN